MFRTARTIISVGALVTAITILGPFFATNELPNVVAQNQQPEPTPPIDLSGKWKLASAPDATVVIDHLLASGRVIARFSPPAPCHDQSRTNLLDSKLRNLSLEDGTIWECTPDKKMVGSCGSAVWESRTRNVTVSSDGKTISGERFYEGYDWDDEVNGKYVNCRREPSRDSWTSWTLTRCDDLNPCGGMAKVMATISKIIDTGPSPTVEEWKDLLAKHKPDLKAELDDLRKQFCDDRSSQAKVDQMKTAVADLGDRPNLTPQQLLAERRKMAGVDLELKVMATSKCTVSGPAPPPTASGMCEGVPVKQAGDDQEIDKMIAELKKSLDKAIKMVEQYEREGKGSTGGARTTAGRYADYYRTEAARYRKLLGYWNNIRAATCVPQEIINLLRSVRDGRADMCTRLCERTADWIAKMYPGNQGAIQQEAFFLVCSANCPD